jgi:hypothetical protein
MKKLFSQWLAQLLKLMRCFLIVRMFHPQEDAQHHLPLSPEMRKLFSHWLAQLLKLMGCFLIGRYAQHHLPHLLRHLK